MGGWGEVGLKVAFGGRVIHLFFAKGFGRKKPDGFLLEEIWP